jgi:hypothetical protein
LIVEINAKEFVDWLFGLPLKKLIKPMRAAQAIAVARRLAELANSQPEFYFLWDLAADVWRLLLFVPDGRVATNEQCTRFLNDYRPYFLNRDLKTAVAAIDKTADVQGPRIARNPDQIEYRLERPVPYAPAVVSGPRTSRRPPADDISERIGVAVDAMTEAKCGRPAASVVDSIARSGLLSKEYCTISHITSRSKSSYPRASLTKQEGSIWLMSYWHAQHPEYVSKSVADPEWPERFVFTQCDC